MLLLWGTQFLTAAVKPRLLSKSESHPGAINFGLGKSFRFTCLIYFFVALTCVRIGEASNPGPHEELDQPFYMGTFNPSGLRNKAQFVSENLSFGDLWSVSETHLNRFDLVDFRKGLHFANSPLKYCIGGHPVTNPHAWKGVAVLSRHPTRPLPHSWPEDVSKSSRALVSTSLIDDAWVHVGTVYGEPDAHSYPNHRQNNEVLLHHVAGRICHLMSGPRMIAGDFNEEIGSLDAFHLMHQAGFIDLQDLALTRWGITPKMTCKGKTRKDYCFISPELQSLLLQVSILDDVVPDHSVLVGHFQRLKQMVPKQIWPVPKQFPWPDAFDIPCDLWSQLSGDVDQKYSQLWTHIEDAAATHVPFRVPNCAKGRARTTRLRAVKDGKFSPVKVGRPGDFQPHFQGASVRHSQWIRQCRRFQSYIRFAIKHAEATSTYGNQVWGSILRAKGFQPNFATWWKECRFRTAAAPGLVPAAPPTARVAQEIFDSVAMAARDLEKTLISESKQYAKLRRAADPCLVFQDLKPPSLVGADLLASSLATKVLVVNPDDCSITLADSIAWDLSFPIFAGGIKLEVIFSEQDCIWLESIEGLAPGMTVTQTQCSGTVSEMHAAFVATWKERWLRHIDVPSERWNAILQFARDHLPQNAFALPSCEVADLQAIIKKKHTKTSCGLDGVTVFDVKHMPPAALQNFCSIFAHAEKTGEWPSKMINGRVACIPKLDIPKTVLDFRPITILGVLYRCWGSHHARNALRAIDGVLPPSLFGSRPGCFASQVWAQLMWSIEHSYSHEIEMCGIVADVQNAFNFLPRAVVTEVLAWIGIPMPVLIGWTGAVQSFTRRFQVRGSLSEPVASVTGYPEGDALSCLAMVAIDWVFHVWHAHFFPLCQPVTYVDDWQLICCQPEAIPHIQECLQGFAQQMDLLLDMKKTYAWCISATGRARLRDNGIRLEANGRNLGAHVQFTRTHANQVLTSRINAVADLWGRLRRSLSAYAHKVSALKVAAWPKALHAVAATTLGHNWFQHLRAGAMKGLSADLAGANANLHLGMVEVPETDPQFWAIIQTFRLARDCGRHSEVRHSLGAVANGLVDLPNNGITTTLLERVQALGWNVSSKGEISDLFGSFSLFTSALGEIKMRAALAWTHVVSKCVAHRPGLSDLHLCDPVHTRKFLRSLTPCDRALMHKALNGTHLTRDGLKYCKKSDDDVCKFCGSSDSRFHRFWICPYFDDLRQNLPPSLIAMLPRLPTSLTEYGWSLQPMTMRRWYTILNAIEAPMFRAPGQPGGTLQLFTDGSCIHQSFADFRFAAWAVISASTDEDAGSVVLDCGHLPGLIQNSYRAEIFAVLRAVRAAHCMRCSAMIWSDCEGVVKRVRNLLRGGAPRVNSPNYDLWVLLAQAISDADQSHFDITYVASHKGDRAFSPLEEWCFRHNHWADRTAVRMNYNRPSEFWKFFHCHVEYVRAAHDISRLVQGVILSISKLAVQSSQQDTDSDQAEVGTHQLSATAYWKGVPEITCFPPDAFRWYPEKLVRLIFSWFLQTVHQSTHEIVWLSQAQLYLDFQMSTGTYGPYKQGTWKDGANNNCIDLAGHPFRTRVRWFSKVLRETLKKCGFEVCHVFGIPCSAALRFHTGVLAVPWPKVRIEEVDRWILGHLPQGVRGLAGPVDRLPCAGRNLRFDDVYITCM